MVALAPALLALALGVDLVRRVHFATTRAALFLGLYLIAEAAGVVVAGLIGRDPARNYALQRRWAAVLGRGALRLFDIRLEVEGAERLTPGGYLLLVRHAAVADVLLPMLLVAVPHHLHPRYVLKRELRWDPCLDVVGGRIPNAFVRRDGTDTAAQLAAVAALGEGLDRGSFVALYPEGTRFTAARRERAIARAEGEDRVAAAALTHTLLPKVGGMGAVLDAAPHADVVVLAHAGLDPATTFADLLRGALVGARWRVSCTRHPRAQVPEEPHARARWLRARWTETDAWVRSVSTGSG